MLLLLLCDLNWDGQLMPRARNCKSWSLRYGQIDELLRKMTSISSNLISQFLLYFQYRPITYLYVSQMESIFRLWYNNLIEFYFPFSAPVDPCVEVSSDFCDTASNKCQRVTKLKDGVDECFCEATCLSTARLASHGPVCGTDHLTYENACALENAACGKHTNISLLSELPCGELQHCDCHLEARDHIFVGPGRQKFGPELQSSHV